MFLHYFFLYKYVEFIEGLIIIVDFVEYKISNKENMLVNYVFMVFPKNCQCSQNIQILNLI